MAELEGTTLPGGGSAPIPIPRAKSEGTLTESVTDSEVAFTPKSGSRSGRSGSSGSPGGETAAHPASASASVPSTRTPSIAGSPQLLPEHAILDTPTLGPTTPADKSPQLTSRHPSFSGSSSYQEDWDIPPLDRLTVLDLLDNFALPQQLEKLSKGISAQTRKLRKSRDAIKSRSQVARERMVEEWRHRVPSAEEQLDRYRKRMRASVEKLGRQWNDTRVITMREKVSFICGVLNIFISGYLIGGFPQWMHVWYTAQILYFMPIRFYTYHRRGYHYFLADLCYFVNLLLVLSLWVFPASKRLFVSTYCLAYGNNAVAIIMWRNSLVFHSFDKVTSLFIHVMPCATLHCMVHLLDPALQKTRFPAIYALQHTAPGAPGAYANVFSMLAWSTIPYALWQLSYYFFITVRRRDKIAAGRPTSFTWLRRSYSKTLIGRIVLSLPMALQEPAFMLIQYNYAVLTMLPCPIWFAHSGASSVFLMGVFTWSIYNGATYYIDVFGKRFQKELEAMRLEVAKWQVSESVAGSSGGGRSGNVSGPGSGSVTPGAHAVHDMTPSGIASNVTSPPLGPLSDQQADGKVAGSHGAADRDKTRRSIDRIPLLEHEDDEHEHEHEHEHVDEDDGESGVNVSGISGVSSVSTNTASQNPGAASAAEAMVAAATMTGADWDLGAKDVARRHVG